jgi:hypothetical protein
MYETTRYGRDGWESEPPSGKDISFFLQIRPDLLWGAASLLYNVYRGSSPGVNRQRRGVHVEAENE